MPWRKTEPMEQRTEFALRAMRTLEFRAVCRKPRRATSGKSVFGAKGWPEWKKKRVDLRAVRNNGLGGVCEIVRLKLAHTSSESRVTHRHDEADCKYLGKRFVCGSERCPPGAGRIQLRGIAYYHFAACLLGVWP